MIEVQIAGAGAGNFQNNNQNQQAQPKNDDMMNQDYDISSDASFTADDIPF